ncbi:MAG: DUF1453 family protein [Candidatus Eremiobacteraeota bacterium]|nr:DUF1453 family protein [Candidatus Eremiobacteraeota bacterium]
MHQTQLLNVAIVGVLIVIVVWRNARPQTMTVSRLWIMPAFMVLVTAFLIVGTVAQHAAIWLLAIALVIGIIAGVPVGLARGHHSRVRHADKSGRIVVEPSVVTMVIWLAAFGLKYAVKYFAPHAGPGVLVFSDGFIAFAVASVVAARYVIFKKFKALEAPVASAPLSPG